MVKEFLRRSYSTTEIGQNSDISHCPLVLSYGYRLVPWMRPKHLTFDGVFSGSSLTGEICSDPQP